MPEAEIPPDVARYTIAFIDSVPQLETLMLLREYRDRAWAPAEVAARIYISPGLAAALLLELTKQEVCSPSGEGEARVFTYGPPAALGQIIDRVAETYRTALIPLTNLIHAKPRASLTQFAGAFRIGKGN